MPTLTTALDNFGALVATDPLCIAAVDTAIARVTAEAVVPEAPPGDPTLSLRGSSQTAGKGGGARLGDGGGGCSGWKK